MNKLKANLNWLWDTFKVAWPLWGAAILTAGFASWVYFLAHEVTVHGTFRATRWEHFLQGRPSELGDALAGFVGSLTLIWVVASVIQQSMELKAQRREFVEMVRAQDAQVSALEAQAEVFRDEQKSRHQEDAKETLDAALTRIAYRSFELCPLSATLRSRDGATLAGTVSIFSKYDGVENLDYFLQNSHHGAIWNHYEIVNNSSRVFELHTSSKGAAEQLAAFFEEVLRMADRLSDGQKVRLESLRVKEVYDLILGLLASDKWWLEE